MSWSKNTTTLKQPRWKVPVEMGQETLVTTKNSAGPSVQSLAVENSRGHGVPWPEKMDQTALASIIFKPHLGRKNVTTVDDRDPASPRYVYL